MSPRMRLGALAVPQPATFAVLLATLAGTHAHAHAKKRPLTRCPGASLPQVTISPLPGTPDATPQTQISFLGASAGQLRSIYVIGSRSGRHGGALRSYQAARGASFLPSSSFAEGEHVTVCAALRIGGGLRHVATSFTVARQAKLSYQPPFEVPGTRGEAQTYHSTDVKPPKITIAQQPGESSSSEYLFATPYAGPAEHGAMIFESSGRLIWFHRPPNPNWGIANLQPQSWNGHQDIVWWQGQINTYGFGAGEDVIANGAYEQVAKVSGGNGLQADLHDVALTSSGAAFITAYQPVQAAAVPIPGGKGLARSATVLDCSVQEIDVRTGLVMWEWQSLGHVPLGDSHLQAPANGPYDYFHLDSLQQLSDGDLLLDARNTWAVYDVRQHTGRVAWQLGGAGSSYELAPSARFGWPEDAQMLGGERIALYDGGAASGSQARGEVIELQPASGIATLAPVGSLKRGTGSARSAGDGSVQQLPGGGFLVGFDGLPNFTEWSAEGGVAYDARFPASEVGYRIYREPWHGQPTATPNVVVTSSGSNTTVYASWNGATDVSFWLLLAGSTPLTLEPVATVPDAGFETAITTHAAAYVQVQALNAEGDPLSESKPILAAHS